MHNSFKSSDNVNKFTYQVDSYFPFKREVWPIVCYVPDTGLVLDDKVTRLVSGEILWEVNTLHTQMIYP